LTLTTEQRHTQAPSLHFAPQAGSRVRTADSVMTRVTPVFRDLTKQEKCLQSTTVNGQSMEVCLRG
jgi:hypothetical protein